MGAVFRALIQPAVTGCVAGVLLLTACVGSKQSVTATPTASARTATAAAGTPSATDLRPSAAAGSPTAGGGTVYPLHRNITATVFWVGEPKGKGSSENNAMSAWDDAWQEHYGGFDDYEHRQGFFPAAFRPKENPFYFDLPYNDLDDSGKRKANAAKVVPWATARQWAANESMLKNRWIRLTKGGKTCYAQWEDAGPYQYDDYAYVFGTADPRPKNSQANNAGMDVSPAVRDCLAFSGVNNDENTVDWQFVDSSYVPPGPWKEIVTTSQVFFR